MELRTYQREAVNAVWSYLEKTNGNPCIEIPTGGGKTPIISELARQAVLDWGGRVVILSHIRELLQQSLDTLIATEPKLIKHVGVYSAGLGKKEKVQDIIIGGIQSVYQRACELGPFNIAIIDEAHLIPHEGEGMYRTFLKEARVVNPELRLIGMTATPFRLSSGELCGPENLLTEVCYKVGVRELIVQGYLCKLVSKAGTGKIDTSALHIHAGEFVADEAAALMDTPEKVRLACLDIEACTKERKSILVFCTSVIHAEHVTKTLNELNIQSKLLTGETPSGERTKLVADFKSGALRCLVNIGVCAVGFDAPNVDCVALLFPTASPGRFYQACGRGFRIAPEKKDCLVLDFGGNTLRHGPVDDLSIPSRQTKTGKEAPAKECPGCGALIHASYTTCPECGHEFKREMAKHEGQATTVPILREEFTQMVSRVFYAVHTKKGSPEGYPKTLRVEYKTDFMNNVSEWVCPEHQGYARRKFEMFWTFRGGSLPHPATAQEAVDRSGELMIPGTLVTIMDGKWERVVRVDDLRKPGEAEVEQVHPEETEPLWTEKESEPDVSF